MAIADAVRRLLARAEREGDVPLIELCEAALAGSQEAQDRLTYYLVADADEEPDRD